MDICYAYYTALHLWRMWSHGHPLSVDEFHRLDAGRSDHLPAVVLETPRSLIGCATTEHDMASVLAGTDASMRRTLVALHESPPLDCAVHVLIAPHHGQHRTKKVVFHQVPPPLPRGSVLELAPHVFCCSPEYLFVQMAEVLDMGALVALGYELCGCYPLKAGRASSGLVRGQLTTPERLMEFVGRADGMRGVRRARVALRHVHAKSASVTETEVSMMLSMPRKRGGYGLPPGRLNERFRLSPSAQIIARLECLTLDLCWPEKLVALEYDGRVGHSEEHDRVRDSRRRDAFVVEGIRMATVTWNQLSSVHEFEAIASFVAKALGKRQYPTTPTFREAQSSLRAQIRGFHKGVW